jgi:hypothetical protein
MILPAYCALAATGHAAASPSSDMRRFIFPFMVETCGRPSGRSSETTILGIFAMPAPLPAAKMGSSHYPSVCPKPAITLSSWATR